MQGTGQLEAGAEPGRVRAAARRELAAETSEVGVRRSPGGPGGTAQGAGRGRRGGRCPYLGGSALRAPSRGPDVAQPAARLLFSLFFFFFFFLPQRRRRRLQLDPPAAEGRVCVRLRASRERAAREARGEALGRRPAGSAGTAAVPQAAGRGGGVPSGPRPSVSPLAGGAFSWGPGPR